MKETNDCHKPEEELKLMCEARNLMLEARVKISKISKIGIHGVLMEDIADTVGFLEDLIIESNKIL